LPNQAVSDCPKCNLQIEQGTGIEAVHPLELLAKAYSEERYIPVKMDPVFGKKALKGAGAYDCP
jgi:hypothetical protein